MRNSTHPDLHDLPLHRLLGSLNGILASFRHMTVSTAFYQTPLISGHLVEFSYNLIKLQVCDPLLVYEFKI